MKGQPISIKGLVVIVLSSFLVLGGIALTLFLSARFVAIPFFGPDALDLERPFGVNDVVIFLGWLVCSLVIGSLVGAGLLWVLLKIFWKE